MQLFGLISLMIVITLAAWWLVNMGPVSAPPSDSEAATSSEAVQTQHAQPDYGSALDSARGAADSLEN